MNKKTYLISGITLAAGLAIILSVLLLQSSDDSLMVKETPGEATVTDLGFTYLQISPRISDYYNLGVDSGALITGVIPDSPADRAGLLIGDVILSFGGTVLEDTTPLLGMMMTCQVGHVIDIDVSRDKIVNTITLDHTLR